MKQNINYTGITSGVWKIKKVFENEYQYLITDDRINDEKTLPICSVFASNINESAEANAEAIASLPDLIKENEHLKRLLESLTPSGSEFVNDPEYCASWVKEQLRGIPSIILPFKRKSEKLEKENEEFKNALRMYVELTKQILPAVQPQDAITIKVFNTHIESKL